MEQKELQQILVEAYQGAPPVIQEYISSGKSEEHLTYLKQRFGLSARAAEELSNEILLALLGLSDPLRIAERLPVESEFALDIVGPLSAEVTRMVFEPLRKKVAATQSKTTEAGDVAAAPATPVTPPINRLSPPETTPPAPEVSKPVAPVKTVPATTSVAPVVPPKAPTPPAPIQKIAPIVAPAEVKPKPVPPPPLAKPVPPPPPVPPLMPPPPAEVKKTSPPSSAPKKTDPYREPIE